MKNSMTQAIAAKFALLEALLDERTRRRWAAVEAQALGRGGIRCMAEATGLSRATIRAGLRELTASRTTGAEEASRERIRRAGGGRRPMVEGDPRLLQALERLVEPVSRGDPMSPLRWTCKSAARLAEELCGQGYAVSERTINRLLHALGYSLQSNRKTQEGRQPRIAMRSFSTSTGGSKPSSARGSRSCRSIPRKMELVGEFRNGGREWQPLGQPERVNVHDFPDEELGKVIPYGVYDMAANTGWVSVGVDQDTAEFAVETLRRWWHHMGHEVYPQATRLLITADGGGSNGSRSRLWKVELQKLADELELQLSVCHFPPGTSKWNKIEHRMFCHITENWRGRPLVSREVVVNLIGHTTTKTGLEIRSALDENRYPTGREITDEQMEDLAIKREKFHGEWNYTLNPRS
jgi:Rhodopirellula transposase.